MWFQGQDTQEMGVWLGGTFVENWSGNGIEVYKKKKKKDIRFFLCSEANDHTCASVPQAMQIYNKSLY